MKIGVGKPTCPLKELPAKEARAVEEVMVEFKDEEKKTLLKDLIAERLDL